MKTQRITPASIAFLFAFVGAFGWTSDDSLLKDAYYVGEIVNEDDQVVTACIVSKTTDDCTIIVQNTRCQVMAVVPNRDAYNYHTPVTCAQPLYRTMTPS